MYISYPPSTDSTLNKFIVYRSITGESSDYEPIDTVDYVSGQIDFESEDHDIEELGICTVWYKVNAIWGNNGDTCTSPYARSKLLPIYDYVAIDYCEGIKEKPSQTTITIYPNPVTGTIYVESKSIVNKIIIYDLTGKELLQKPVNNQQKTNLDVSFLKNGIYLLKVITSSGVISKKFIKKE